ncbi:MarR family transcriptional regulator [Nocardioides sp. zg-DK7169]|uniref:MarR family winged helix-turn-helix transcriptional regulator n=1 Tax=Nocardioides sp. zg-DK7169 TaxID=2736600 RepID=UPI0015569417|nr:MarR family transcriptional regulator [Nocardioides sp. zg-DK7169]
MTPPDCQREELVASVSGHLAALDDLATQLRLEALVASELSLQQLKVLLLAVHRAPITAHEVAGALGVTAATVSGLIRRLGEHGLLVREEAPQDRRARHLVATPAGRQALEELASFQLRSRLGLLEHLDDEDLATLDAGLAVARRALAAHVAEETGGS